MRLGTVVLWSVLLLVGASAQDISSLISKSMFESMLPNRNDGACPARGFYTYEAFIEAAKSFGAFANTGDIETRKREIVAFLGQTSHQTTGGWDAASNGTYSWGYCYKESTLQIDRCVTCEGGKWPCVQGKQYYGRGPIQLSYNCNYGQAGDALGLNLLEYPELVAIDPIISFQAAFWFWMTPQPPKPSCHEVMTGEWTPSEADIEAGRFPGYGLCTNIITGGGECGKGDNQFMENRIGFYKHFCDMMGLDYGEYLDCANQTPYGNGIESMIHLAENKSPQ